MAIAKDKGPKFQVFARRVAILSVEVIGVKTMQEAMDKAKTLDLDDFGEEDSSFIITGVQDYDKHFNTD